MTDTQDFFSTLPPLPPFEGLCDLARHRPVPEDWCVVVADIAGSTRAVKEGRYKDVNVASAGTITAVLNAAGAARDDVAYIFGGDGATFLLPPQLKAKAAAALYGARELVRRDFRLDMRVGMVGVDELLRQGAPVRAARIEMAPGLYQAALSGHGVALAEKLVKDKEAGRRYDIASLFDEKELARTPPDLAGLECRWQPLKSRNGENISLIVQGRCVDDAANAALYQDMLARINALCGGQGAWSPVSPAQLNIASSPAALTPETRARTHGQGMMARAAYLARLLALTGLGKLCFRFGWKAGDFDGRTYRQDVTRNSDYMKFDNVLRLIMDVTVGQKAALEALLEDLLRQRKIYYGLHASGSALMTCLVFDYRNAHLHFIDGAEGGYSLASVQLKRQVKEAGS